MNRDDEEPGKNYFISRIQAEHGGRDYGGFYSLSPEDILKDVIIENYPPGTEVEFLEVTPEQFEKFAKVILEWENFKTETQIIFEARIDDIEKDEGLDKNYKKFIT